MVLKKYKTRSSPNVSANSHCGKTRRGNDGQMYISKRTSRGYCRWQRKGVGYRVKSSRKGRRRTKSRSRNTKSSGGKFTSATISLSHSYGYKKKTEKFKKPLTRTQARQKMKKYCKVDCFMEDDTARGSRLIIDTGS